MSLFIHVSGKPLIVSRERSVSIAVNQEGEVVLDGAQPHLQVDSVTRSMTVKNRGVICQKALILEGTVILLDTAVTVEIRHMRLTIWLTSRKIEILSRVSTNSFNGLLNLNHSEKKAGLCLGSSETQDSINIPLIVGTTLRCGSSQRDSVFLASQNLRKSHFDLSIDQAGTVLLRPCTGLVNGSALPQRLEAGNSISICEDITMQYT